MSTNTDNFEEDLTPDIEKLKLSDTFYTWFTTTNKLIDYVNPIQIYDLLTGSGFTRTELNGEVTIDLNVGKGIKLYPEIGNGSITLDIANIYSVDAQVKDNDYILVERYDTGDTNYLFSVQASDILPPTLNDDHEFMGEITIDSLNVRTAKVNLNYGKSATTGVFGFNVDINGVSKQFGYNAFYKTWIFDSNIQLKNTYSFISDNDSIDAHFRFATSGKQYDVTLELATGLESTSADDTSWKIQARKHLNRLDFIYGSSEITDLERTVFYARVDNVYTNSSTFVISDKIQIGNIAGSTNFAQTPDYTQYKIPVTDSTGILNSKWTNRYVTSDYVSLSVGNLVKIFDNTNNDTYITRCDLSTSSTSESDTFTFGIVERISGGLAYIVMLGEFNLQTTPSPALEPGLTYYLTSGSPNFTKTKPTSGLIKPVFIATGTASGIIFPMTSNALSFGNVSVSSAESGYIVGSGSAVYSNASNGNVNLVAGSGITLQTDPTTRNITIRSTSGSNKPGWSTIRTDTGDTLYALTPTDTLKVTGGSGGIVVDGDNNTNNDVLTIKGKYFRRIGITGDDTNAETGTITAGIDDTLTIYAGAGIRLTNPTGNVLRFEATGNPASTIPNYSLSLLQLQKQPKNSILVSRGGGATLQEVYGLQASYPSILFYNGKNSMGWYTMINIFKTNISAPADLTSGETQLYNSESRFLGISLHTEAETEPKLDPNGNSSVACFIYDETVQPNGSPNIRLGLVEGDGIQLDVINDTTDPNYVGVPAIRISNTDATSKFKNVVITNTNETIVANSNGILRLTSPSGSPISLDADSNSDTVYFNITAHSIKNQHLAEMADNTVKIGKGDTHHSTPQDLFIGQYSVLGRLGSDLVSLNAAGLRTILGLSGSNYFRTIISDSGSLTASDDEIIHISGGLGISTSIGTDNEIVITNTLPISGDLGISVIGYRDLPSGGTAASPFDSIIKINKLYFGKGDFDFSFTKPTSVSGVVTPRISWSTLGQSDSGTVNTGTQGSGLVYGKASGTDISTQFSQIGNGVLGWRIPYIDTADQTLKYFGAEDATLPVGSPYLSQLIGFAFDGSKFSLVKTNAYVGSLTSNITGIYTKLDSGVSWSINRKDTEVLTFKQYKADLGNYWSTASAFILEPTSGRDFIVATSQTTTAFTTLSSIKFASSLTQNNTPVSLGNPPTASYTSITDNDISIKTFTTNWYQLGASSTSTNRLCMPTMMIGTGPTNATSTASNGYLIRNDSTNGALVFTNFNLNTTGSLTTKIDRSSRLSLEIMNVDSVSSNAYSSLKSTGSITHTYANITSTPGLVDTFTFSGYKSIKYLIQAVSNTNKVFTTEFIVQANTNTNYCNYVQYASVSEPAGFSLDITATLATNTLTVSSNAVSAGVTLTTMKVMKLEM